MKKPQLKMNTLPSSPNSPINPLGQNFEDRYKNSTSLTTQCHSAPIHQYQDITNAAERVQNISNIPQKITKSQQNRSNNYEQFLKTIQKRMQTDRQFSSYKNSQHKQIHYNIGSQIAYVEKIKGIPKEIVDIVNKYKEKQKNVHLVYGYLKGCDSVFYIVQNELIVINFKYLQKPCYWNNFSFPQQQNSNQQNQRYHPQTIISNRYKIRQNCRNIYQISLQNNKRIDKQFRKNILILQYPQFIQFIGYKVNLIQSSNGQQKIKMDFISLDMKVSLKSPICQFITPTLNGDLLYLNKNGQVKCFDFEGNSSWIRGIKSFLNRVFIKSKQDFISRNHDLLSQAIRNIRKSIDVCCSYIRQDPKNLKLIYNLQKNKIYTLIEQKSRQNIIKQSKKIINVYQFYYVKQQKNCFIHQLYHRLQIKQEQILDHIYYNFGLNLKYNSFKIFTIEKVEDDYNQLADLCVILENGIKLYIAINFNQKNNKKIILVDKILPFDFNKLSMLKQSSQTQFKTKKFNIWLQNYYPKNKQFQQHQGKQFILKQLYQNRNISLGLVKSNQDKKNVLWFTKKLYDKNYQEKMYYMEVKHGEENFMKKFQSNINIQQNFFYQVDCNYHMKYNLDNIRSISKVNDGNSYINLLQISKNEYSRHSHIQNTHDYLRQTYYPPQNFVYMSNRFICNIIILRPIDQLYMYLKTCQIQFIKKNLLKILNISIQQICCMLIQIYTNKQHVYYTCSKNYQNRISQYVKSQVKQIQMQRTEDSEKKKLQKYLNYKKNNDKNAKVVIDHKDIIRQKIKNMDTFEKKIENLFKYFCQLQRVENEKFQDIIFNSSTEKSNNNYSSNLVRKLNQASQKSTTLQPLKSLKTNPLQKSSSNQIHFALLYISRVLFPIWKSSKLVKQQSQVLYDQIISKLQKLSENIVSLLKASNNQCYNDIKNFIRIIIQTIHMFIYLRCAKLPQSMSLQLAMSQNKQYFQPFIFTAIQRERNPQLLVTFKHFFPTYLTKDFQLIISIYGVILPISNQKQIMKVLQRKSSYPKYFIKYLKQIKKLKNTQILKQQNQIKIVKEQFLLPAGLPVQNQLELYVKNIKKKDKNLQQRLKFLNNLKLLIQKLSQNRIQNSLISKFMLNYYSQLCSQYFKILNLQQQCIKYVQKIPLSRNYHIIQKNKNFKITKQQEEQININRIKYMNIINNLKTAFYSIKQIKQFITQKIKSPRLNIYYYMLFQYKQTNIEIINNDKDNYKYNKYFLQQAQQIFIQGRIKFQLNNYEQLFSTTKLDKNKQKQYKQLIKQYNKYLHDQFQQLFTFLISSKQPIRYQQILHAYQNNYLDFKQFRYSLLTEKDQLIFFIYKQLTKYLNKNKIAQIKNQQLSKYFVRFKQIYTQSQSQQHKEVQFQEGINFGFKRSQREEEKGSQKMYEKQFKKREKYINDVLNDQVNYTKNQKKQEFSKDTELWIIRWYNYLELVRVCNRQKINEIRSLTNQFYHLTKNIFIKKHAQIIQIIQKMKIKHQLLK